MNSKRLMRLMAGDLPDRAQRLLAREQRRLERAKVEYDAMMAFVDRIRRRQDGADDLPPMPLNFAEIERRRREGR